MRLFRHPAWTGRLARWLLFFVGGAVLLSASLTAQQPGTAYPQPRLNVVSPNGARAGTSIEVSFTGTDAEEPQGLLFNHPGIKAEPVLPPETPNDPKKEEPKKDAPRKKKAGGPPPVVTKFKVSVAVDVPPAAYDVRLVNKWGVSNARAFVVGDLPEVAEKEPNNDLPQTQKVDLNATVNGVVSANTDVDYYTFTAKKGQRVVVSCLTSSIDSRLYAHLELYDAANRFLTSNRRYRDNDAVVDVVAPADGDYHVRVSEFTYTQGSPEHFSRLSVSTAPWIDAVHPAVVEPGKPTPVTVYGRNLPGGRLDPAAVLGNSVLEKVTVTVTPPAAPAAAQSLTFAGLVSPPEALVDGFEYRLQNAAGVSNPYLITFARGPVVPEGSDHGTADKAQAVTVPCEIAGRIDRRRDRDWYSFPAKKGDSYILELMSERLAAPTRLYFAVKSADAKQDIYQSAEVNPEPPLHPIRFYSVAEDPPPYTFTAPADGKYLVLVTGRDADLRFGPDHVYRLRVTPAKPDFRVFVQPPDEARPDGCVLYQGGHQLLNILVARQDGFTGPVTLIAENLPKGVSCPPQTLGPKLKSTALVLSAAPDAPAWAGEIKVVATATVNGQPVTREARPVAITWPVQPGTNVPALSRLERSLILAVRDKGPFSLTATLDKPLMVQGTKGTITLKLLRNAPDFKKPVAVTAVDPQTNLAPVNLVFNNNQPVTIPQDKNEATVAFDVKTNTDPGTYNLVLKATAPVPFAKDPMAKQKPDVNVILPAAPIALKVLPQTVAQVSVNNATTTLKLGTQAELVVKVNRLHDYAGPFKVQLVLPANVKGVSAEDVTLPAGQNEVKWILRAPAGAAPANLQNLVVRLTAALEGGNTATQETKINVNVVK